MCKKWVLLVSLIVLLGAVNSASAINWTGAGVNDSWCTPENWEPNIIPALWDVAVISTPEQGPVIDCNVDVGAIQGPMWNSPNDQVMDVTSGTFLVRTGWDWSSGTGTATIDINGAPDVSVVDGWLAPNEGTGILNISGDPNIVVSGGLAGAAVNGSFFEINMSGGYVYADFIRFGDDGGGELNLSGGTIDLSGYLQFTGGAGNAVTLNMTGGLINIDGWFQAPLEANGADAVTINLDGGTIRCTWFTHADVAYALDIKDGILIIDGDVRDDIIADVNVGYITAHNGTGRVFVSYDPVTTETTVSARPVATFETATSSGIESGSSAIIAVILYNPSGANTVTVDYAVTGGTADGNGTDYTLAPGTLVFDPCVGTRTIEIAIVDDGFDEEDETIEVTLSEPVNGTLGAITQHTYTIVDPRPIVAFDAEASRGKEDVSPVEIPVSLSWVWPDTVTVDYNVTGGTAASGEDYSLPYGTLVFEPCSVTKYISIAIVEDDYLEIPDETIEITLSNPSVGRLKTNTQHTYTILPPPAQVCPEGDLDGDCEVDYNDLGVFASQWLDPPGSCSGPNCADLDGVNGIDTFDFALFAANWRVEAWPIVINEFMASNEGTIQDPQEQYDDWIEIYNGSGVAVDIGGMWLADTGNLWMIPDDKPAETTIAAGGYVLIWADRDTGHTPGLHADFKLDRGGDRIELYAYDGVTLIDGIRFEEQETDISYGRYPDAEDSWRFFATPTPLAENEGAYIDEVADTKFSHDRGFYDSAFNLSITCATGGATIHYTLDGNEPNEFIFPGNGTYQYTGPIDINQTTFVRAAAFKPGYVPTNADTHTYIFGANSVRKVLPTISLVGGELVDRTGAVSMELIYGDPNDGEGFQADCESEAHSIRSYRIKFKAEYGTSQLNYPFFESAPLYADSAADRFDRLVLRDKSQKDVTWVAEPWTRLTQISMSGPSHGGHSMYVHLYVNGIYKGLINPVERPDAWFASSYFGGDFDDYFATNHHELPDFGNHYLSGEPNRYETLLDMAYEKNLEDPNNYEDFRSLCDVIQFADYTILYWYSDFEDGVSNNYYAFMRNNPLEGSVPPEGLMYYMWDAEFAFTSCERPRVESSFFNRDAPIGHIWRALLENTDFRILFADRIYKHCFNDGALTDENAEARWDLLYDYIASGGRTPYVAECFGGIPGSRDAFISMLRDWSEPNDWPGVELYPDFDPPTFNQQGGQVASGFNLEMFDSSEHGDVYYTLDGSDPREAVTGNIVGMEYDDDDPIPLDRSRHVKARVFDDHDPNWSALNEVIFAVGPVADDLRITEIMYHPQDTNDPNDPNTEFIELKNIGAGMLNLNLVSFTDGIDFTFPIDSNIPAGGYILVVKDQNAFEAKYSVNPDIIAGEYTGRLNNGGERITLEDAIGQTILDFEYRDSWHPITDGEGYSLSIIEPDNSDPNSWSEKDSWRASAYVGGSPGWDDSGIVPNPGAIVINEVMAHSHLLPDWIELYNTTDGDINIGGWFLSDSDSNVMKYEIAADTVIEVGQYLVFYEDTNFGNANDPGYNIAFAFSENGEEVCLSSGVDGNGVLTGYREVEDFGASESNVSFGRYFKGSTGNYNFVAMDHNTPWVVNAYPKVGPIVINEIMYHPDWPANSLYENEDFEYIELYNITDSDVNLYDDQGNAWKFTDGIEFTFPADTEIPAYGYLVVVRDLMAFLWRYGSMPPGVVYGPYDGKLSNGGEKLELSMPGDIDLYGTRHYIRIDRVNYSDGSHPEDCPGGVDLWDIEADGGGQSLARIDANLYGNDPNNWDVGTPSPGSVNP